MLHGRCRPGFDYLAHRKIGGLLAAAGRSPLAGDLARFTAAATDLDYSDQSIKRAAERVVVAAADPDRAAAGRADRGRPRGAGRRVARLRRGERQRQQLGQRPRR